MERELTFGEKLVGLNFNPSNDVKVQRAKVICAELADLLYNEQCHRESDNGNTLQSVPIYNTAIGAILHAQMDVVKFITLKY